MDIRQLEAFVYTVKYQSFSQAAQKLYLSQPTVSAHIRSLEQEFHTQLLKRTTKTLSVTPAGMKLYQYASEITISCPDSIKTPISEHVLAWWQLV